MGKRFHVEAVDIDNGFKSYQVHYGGQTVATVDEDLFHDPWESKRWADKICDALNKLDQHELD